MSMIDEKKKTLAEFLGCSEDDIVYQSDWDAFEVNDEEYRVLDEEEARQAMHDDQEAFIDDLGIKGYTKEFQDWVYENALNQDWFEEACQEIYEEDYNDAATEYSDSYENLLIESAIRLGVIDMDDIEDGKYIGPYDEYNLASMCAAEETENTSKDYHGNFAKWYSDSFGYDSLKDVIKRGIVSLDIDAITDEIIAWDGYGILATYDGEDNEENGFHILRTN